ncbi:MAG TPA: glycosyltransferase family 39 protein [Solirubrobacteraceae bacterium]|nr:glycosyltransferase family 39 protein [Solirubrobacteraceae bacterium]
MSEAHVLARPPSRLHDAPARGAPARLARVALPAILLVAALNFGWQLGSSSFFVDEILSMEASTVRLSRLLHAIRLGEQTPPAYFLFEHEWLYHTHSRSEWVARLPSAVAGVAVVAVVYWLARLLAGRRAALVAATLAALSPFLLEFAQRAQGYVFDSLLVALAVAAAVQATRASAHARAWLSLSAVAAVLALWTGYTDGFVLAPLCLWVATRDSLPVRARAGHVLACAIAQAAVLPLFVAQAQATPHRGLGAVAGVTWSNVVQVFGTAFDPRTGGGANALRLLGAALVLGAAAILARAPGSVAAVRERTLLIVLALLPPMALLVLSLFGLDLMLTRYDAGAAPGQLALVAAAIAASPRAWGALLAAVALTVALGGTLGSHRSSGFYLNARGITRYISAQQQPGDIVATPGLPGTNVPLAFYAPRELHPNLPFKTTSPAMFSALPTPRPRLWLVMQIPTGHLSSAALLTFSRDGLAPYGYRALSARVFTSVAPMAVLLATPDR